MPGSGAGLCFSASIVVVSSRLAERGALPVARVSLAGRCYDVGVALSVDVRAEIRVGGEVMAAKSLAPGCHSRRRPLLQSGPRRHAYVAPGMIASPGPQHAHMRREPTSSAKEVKI